MAESFRVAEESLGSNIRMQRELVAACFWASAESESEADRRPTASEVDGRPTETETEQTSRRRPLPAGSCH